MNRFLPDNRLPRNQIQTRLMILAAIIVFLSGIILTMSTAVRLHTWVAPYRWEHWVGISVWFIGFAILFAQSNRYLPEHDPYLLPVISLLCGLGLVIIFRLTPAFGFRQTAWLAIGIAGITLALRIRNLLSIIRRYKYVWLISGILLTLLTFVVGTYPGGIGPELWLSLGSLYLQPSEILKFLLITFLAAYLADAFPARPNLVRLLTPTVILIGFSILVLVAQRDLGTASLFLVLYTLVVYLSSGKRRVLLISFVLLIVALIAGYLIFDVIQLRIEAWLNPWVNARDRSYQIIQSLIAAANGGVLGRGLGLGSPGVVPVAHSDFIFTAILEEFGVAGSVAVICLYALLLIRGFQVALHAPNQFQRLLAAGFSVYFAVQAILIMGGTIRLLPLTGVTLPFVSYGGTSLIVSLASGMLLMLISNRGDQQPAPIEKTRSYLFAGSALLIGFIAVAVMSAFWGFFRSDALLARGDNPRRAISDRYVYRGTIFDLSNTALTSSSGKPGEMRRVLNYPSLSSIVGYSDPNYGQTGIEYKMDGYLRGVTENSPGKIMATRLLYGQYPAGFDLRLSLDLRLQQISDELLKTYTGAAILMNADTGEILAMSTSPTFDANLLDENWETWMQDERAPLLNRATQSLYPPGSTTGGVVLARFLSRYTVSATIPSNDWNTDFNSPYFCAIQPTGEITWGKLITSGCINALTTVSRSWPLTDTLDLYQQTGLYKIQELPLEFSQPVIPAQVKTHTDLYSGAAGLLVSPLQVAVMASTLSNGGHIITPQIVTAYRPQENDWTLLDKGKVTGNVTEFDARLATGMLTQGDFPGWEVSSLAGYENALISWYLAGTTPDWQGTSLVVVVALEDGSVLQSASIGRQVFLAATSTIQK